MNYPIYNYDYEYTLEEVVRYIRFFDNHKVHITIAPNFVKEGIFYSHHHYLEDELLIRLHWRTDSRGFASGKTTIKDLFKAHKQKFTKLVKYEFIRYSANLILNQTLPTEECKNTYFKKVMKNRKKHPYNNEEYQIIEHLIRRKPKIPDVFFEMLTDEISNTLAFEKYYNKTRKQQKNHKVN